MWTYNSVFYQIYPIGFCGAPVHNDGVTVPRIRKIMEWSDYLWAFRFLRLCAADNLCNFLRNRSLTGAVICLRY